MAINYKGGKGIPAPSGGSRKSNTDLPEMITHGGGSSARRDRNRTIAAAETGIEAQQDYVSGGQQAMQTVRGLLSGGLGDDEHFKAVSGEQMRLNMNRLRASGKSRAPRAFGEALGHAQFSGMQAALSPYDSRINRGVAATGVQADMYQEQAGAYEEYAAAKRKKKGALFGGTAQAISGYFSGNYASMGEGIGTAYSAGK